MAANERRDGKHQEEKQIITSIEEKDMGRTFLPKLSIVHHT